MYKFIQFVFKLRFTDMYLLLINFGRVCPVPTTCHTVSTYWRLCNSVFLS